MRLLYWLITAIACFCFVMVLVSLVAISYEVLAVGKVREELIHFTFAMSLSGMLAGSFVAIGEI